MKEDFNLPMSVTMKEKVQQYLKNCDLLVKPYEFKVSNREGNSTVLGGINSLVIIFIGFFYFISICIKIIAAENIIYAGTSS